MNTALTALFGIIVLAIAVGIGFFWAFHFLGASDWICGVSAGMLGTATMVSLMKKVSDEH